MKVKIYEPFSDCPVCNKDTLKPMKSMPPKVRCPSCGFSGLYVMDLRGVA
jgi:hypothetical protein